MGSILRGLIAYVFLLLMIRITSRRAAGPATPFELILIFLFGGATVQAIVSDDRSITNAFLVVLMIAWMHRTVAILKTRFPSFGLVVDGSPVILVEDGHWHEDRLKALHLHDMDVMASGRQHGVQRREEIRHAIFERNGDIAIIPKENRESGNGDGA